MDIEFKEWIFKLFPFNEREWFYNDTVNEQYVTNVTNTIGFKETNNVIDRISIINKDSHYYYYIHCSWNDKDVLTLEFGYSNRLCINQNYNGEINHQFQYKKKLTIIMFDYSAIYYKCKNNGRLVPLSLKTLLTHKNNPYLYDFIQNYFSYLSKKHPIFKDIFKCMQIDKQCFLPLKINDIVQYHSLKEMFQANYKLSNNINYGWNKRSINLSYMIIKAWNIVNIADRNKLLQITDWNFDDRYSFSIKDNIGIFLFDYIVNNISNIKDENDFAIIRDYIKMCLICKEKINISFKSIKKVKEAHDKLSEKNYMKRTPVVKITKETKFKLLRKILPPEFEWIKTRKRLIEETVMQHHCVWSYADKINKDKCQIYSYVDENEKRYTLEFVIRKRQYVCVQMRGLANSQPPENLRTLVKEILKNQ